MTHYQFLFFSILYYVYYYLKGLAYMLLTCILLSISVSIDAIGIGITYSLRHVKISILAKCLLFLISIFSSSVAIGISYFILKLFPANMVASLGNITLLLIGSWILYQALKKEPPKEIKQRPASSFKIYRFFIRFLGITIQIIRNPKNSDLDQSQTIDLKEAVFLGFALSLDAIGVGICSSLFGFTSWLYPLLVGVFQLLCLSLGKLLSQLIQKFTNFPENIWSLISGILLLFIAIMKFFIGS